MSPSENLNKLSENIFFSCSGSFRDEIKKESSRRRKSYDIRDNKNEETSARDRALRKGCERNTKFKKKQTAIICYHCLKRVFQLYYLTEYFLLIVVYIRAIESNKIEY